MTLLVCHRTLNIVLKPGRPGQLWPPWLHQQHPVPGLQGLWASHSAGRGGGGGGQAWPCLALYHGESGYSAFSRGLDHQDALARRSKTNALWRHCQIYHEFKEVTFQMTVASTHKEPYTRKCREGVSIVAGEQDILLTSKMAFLQGAVPRTRSQRGFG